MARLSMVLVLCGAVWGQPFDLVVAGGRVIDPETGLDAVRNIGIRGGRIARVSVEPLSGSSQIDAGGLVVSPGFVDLHWHGRTTGDYRYCALQGVTSALELEIGVADIGAWYAAREGKALIHHGAAAGHAPIRMAVMRDPGDFLPSGDAANRAATEEEISDMARRLEAQLMAGAPAVGFGIAYTQASSYREIIDMFRIAARFKATSHVHVRGASSTGGQIELGLSEVIAASAITGAPLHVVHINSSSGVSIDSGLQILREAVDRGVDVTTEAYPYTAGATRIEAALFNHWREQPDDWFAKFQWVLTGERLNRETFERYRKQGGRVIMHTNTQERVDKAITSPLTMIASDGSDLPGGLGHPRSSGCFARILAHYVRERKMLSLMDAARKMSYLPARRLEGRVPSMKDKGRIREGADADLAIFDPEKVRDRSTYEQPALEAEGFVHVLVGGTAVVSGGKLVEGVYPGKGIRAALKTGG